MARLARGGVAATIHCMQTRVLTLLFLVASFGLGACATTGGAAGNATMMQTESGDTVQIVHANSVAELTPTPMQCEPNMKRHDLLCAPMPTDHLYASAMGLDSGDGTNVAATPHRAVQCDAGQTDSSGMCMDGSVATDDD